MPSKYLEDEDRLVRHIKFAQMRKDENDQVIGVNPSGFELREGEAYLSFTWCEYFDAPPDQQVRCAILAFKNSYGTKPKSHYWVGTTSTLRTALGARGTKLRIIHEPDANNPAHAAVRNWPQETELLEQVAAEVVAASLKCEKDLDLASNEDCIVSARGAA